MFAKFERQNLSKFTLVETDQKNFYLKSDGAFTKFKLL